MQVAKWMIESALAIVSVSAIDEVDSQEFRPRSSRKMIGEPV
jgi:hypothetical protein